MLLPYVIGCTARDGHVRDGLRGQSKCRARAANVRELCIVDLFFIQKTVLNRWILDKQYSGRR